MQTLVLSDVHLGNASGLDIYAGADVLPAVIDRYAGPDTRIFFNGDTVDFLMNEDPLVLDVGRAVANARAIAAAPASAAVFSALGRAVQAGAEVILRLGNHDVELALPEVQAVFRAALGVSETHAARLIFQLGTEPALLDIGGARVLLSHGEQNDDWNKVDYAALLQPPEGGALPGFDYPPGTRLVKTIMNPLKRGYGLRFADLLKPDFQGAVLALLAVAPEAVQEVFKGSTLTLLWQLFRQSRGPLTFGPAAEPAEPDLGLFDLVDEADLSDDEWAAVLAQLGDGPLSFATNDSAATAFEKLGRKGLQAYARFHRHVTGAASERYFSLTPTEAEQQEALRLAGKFNADAVILGHTHAARFAQEGVVFVNTGTWITLMALPDPDASLEVWADFLALLQDNPGLDPARGPCAPVVVRLTGAVLEPASGGGAQVRLIQFHDARREEVLAEAVVRRSAG